ncbi:MAG: sugar phosphate isomerase/epimerase [Acidimicrobiales bacterium]|nr:sugar phosphate isomerase/epimerase [Acidimicrobiales bacterium]
MTAHERISVNQVSSWDWTLDEDLERYPDLGIHTLGVHQRKLDDTGDAEAAAARVADAGMAISTLLADNPLRLAEPDTWLDAAYELGRTLDLARALGAETVTIPTGDAGTLPWERAADALADALRPTLAEAEREHLVVLLEPTNALRRDLGFVTSLRDAIELGWRLGAGVCVELTTNWCERNLAGTITAGVDRIGLVHVSDLVIGTRCTPDRRVPGDGDLPLGRVVGQLLDAGYDGRFELELRGPHIDEEGYASAIERSLAALADLIEPPDDEDDDDADVPPDVDAADG